MLRVFVIEFFMKKILLFTVIALSLATPVFASPLDGAWNQLTMTAQSGAGYGAPMDPRLIVANLVKYALGLIATIIFALMVYAGYNWMTASGNDEKVAKSKSTIYNSVIGLIIILGAYGLTIAITNLAMMRSLGSNSTGGSTLDNAINRVNQ